MKEITMEMLQGMEERFAQNPVNAVAMNAATMNGVQKAAQNYREVRDARHDFSIQLEAGEVTNQKQSGRCWMFAALNFMRLEVMKKAKLKNMELSQNYPLFYDKLEKSNFFLENIIGTVNEPLDGRLVSYLLQGPLGDGGQWDMFKMLVEKYGVVPKDAMPETAASSATREMTKYLTLKLREFAKDLRTAAAAGESSEQLHARKDEMMDTIYRMLCIALGVPPKTFTYETRDKDNKFVRAENITPQAFFKKYVGLKLDDYVSIINAPTADKPYEKTYTVQYLGNVLEGGRVKYLNLPIEELKALTIRQLKDGSTVWFGSDVGQFSVRDEGLLTTTALEVDRLFSTTFDMSKAERLDYGESLMTHAMLITGVNINDAGVADRYRVENSWGKDVGKDGFYVMSDAWFDNFVYQIVVDKKYLSKAQLAMLAQEPTVLQPWDPMGSLATVHA